MNVEMTPKRWAGLGILILLLLALISSSIYFFYFQPLTKDIAFLQSQLESEKKLVSIMEEKKNQDFNAASDHTKKLQLRVPVKPLADQFLLDLQKAETVSGSEITSLSVNEGDNPAEQNEGEGQSDLEVLKAQQSDPTHSAEKPASPALPESLKKLTFDLTVVSPDYENMIRFLETVEGLERVTKVDALAFDGPREESLWDEGSSKLTYTVKISAFYFPELTELLEDLPRREFLEPAERENPFPTNVQ